MNGITYKGHHISFNQIEDVDGNGALQYFIDGWWHGTVSTRGEAVTRARAKINTF